MTTLIATGERMQTSDFDYDLPSASIAQQPVEPRDRARMLVVERASGAVRHRRVSDLVSELAPDDLLVVNDTRVRPARLYGERSSGGSVELFLLEPAALPAEPSAWRALVRPARRLRAGEEIAVEGGRLRARMVAREAPADGSDERGPWTLCLWDPRAPGRAAEELLEEHGHPPLPPYIERSPGDAREAADRARYQTVYARSSGAVAAPTAGLHFTPELLERLAARGIPTTALTLHVGLGTFQPIQVEDLRAHRMHSEAFVLPEDAVAAIARCRARGGRVVAVGTTSARVLESCVDSRGMLTARRGTTDLFLRPGDRFRAVDALLTNFHLPRSTLLVLVSALLGRERVLALYRDAVAQGYRFYSYGDAMLILP